MQIDIITLFPKIVTPYVRASILGRAQDNGTIDIRTHNLRDWATDKYHTVDDTPYGGGAGMVLKVEPIYRAIQEIKATKKSTHVILLSAKGTRYTQQDTQRLTKYEQIVLICGRYEGVDERVAEYIADEEISIGDFVLTGGELGAMVIADSVARLLPDVLGNQNSIVCESHMEPGYCEYPQYTTPAQFNNWQVPDVLLSGHHQNIIDWRDNQNKKL